MGHTQVLTQILGSHMPMYDSLWEEEAASAEGTVLLRELQETCADKAWVCFLLLSRVLCLGSCSRLSCCLCDSICFTPIWLSELRSEHDAEFLIAASCHTCAFASWMLLHAAS